MNLIARAAAGASERLRLSDPGRSGASGCLYSCERSERRDEQRYRARARHGEEACGGKLEGEIVRIVKRANTQVVGMFDSYEQLRLRDAG